MKVTKSSKLIVTGAIGVALVLTGCGSTSTGATGSSDSGVIHLKYWTPFSGGDADFMKAMVDKFNQSHPSVQVDMLTLDSNQYYTKLSTAVLAKQGPDIAIGHASHLPEMVADGEIQDITQLSQQAGLDWSVFNPNILSSTVFNSEHYAVPNDTHALILFVNKKILGDAGLLDANGKPKIPSGPDGFISFLKTIQSKAGSGIMPFAATSTGNLPFWMWYTLYSQEGGQMLSSDMKTATFDNDKGVKALDLMDQMVKQNLWPKNIANGGAMFSAGKAAIQFNGVWNTGTFEKTAGLQFEAIPLPTIFDKQATWGDSHTFVLPVQAKTDQKKEVAALQFAKWITDNGAMWAKAGHVPAETPVVNSQAFKDLSYRSQYAEIASYVTYLPKSTKVSAITDIMEADINLVMTGQMSPSDALKKAQQEVNAKISQ